MNRAPLPKKQGHRELWVVGLLVLPLVVLGFVLAGMGVLVDPPPVSAPPGTPASPASTPAPAAVLPAHERSVPSFIIVV
ncbi:MAG: hypothetical protein H0W23_07760 [Chloroflexia bacterium]|nr:hypothetical protein [Chloroflexia bacterium]